MPIHVRLKYNWYFRYRECLLQIKYPKYIVELYWGNKPKEGKQLADFLIAKIRSKKGKITEYTNKLNAAIAAWDELFPIEQHDEYKRVVDKIERLQGELIELQKQHAELV